MALTIKLVPHDPNWSQEFSSEADVLREALGSRVIAIHHIGSTSIAGIYAKPVVDILAEVSSLDEVDKRTPRLTDEGYQAMGEYGIPGRRYFRKDDEDGVRQFQVHVFMAGSDAAVRHLAFRDYLRAHPSVAQEYSELKLGLVAQHPADMKTYMDGKGPFIQAVQDTALVWLRERTLPAST